MSPLPVSTYQPQAEYPKRRERSEMVVKWSATNPPVPAALAVVPPFPF
jgi:hypothetical protein